MAGQRVLSGLVYAFLVGLLLSVAHFETLWVGVGCLIRCRCIRVTLSLFYRIVFGLTESTQQIMKLAVQLT